MKKSPRLLAGLVVLGLFAVVGTLTLSAFDNTPRSVSAPQGATEARDGKDSQFQETARKGSTVVP
jgi:hypothetical protein